MRSLDPIGHGAVLEGLWRAARERRLAHALLFTGASGVGKFLSAERLTAGLVCERGPGVPCGVCGAEKRLRAGVHPDVFVLDVPLEAGDEIQIHWITRRDTSPDSAVLLEFLSLRPAEGGWRVALVRDAERLSEEAQNAFLKTLEEPGENVLLVLVTSRPGALLPTVRSRTVEVAFAPLPEEDVLAILRRDGVEGALDELARAAHGSPGAAARMALENTLAAREIVASVLAGEAHAVEGSAALFDLPGEFTGKTDAAAARHLARARLDLVIAVLLDVARAQAGVPSGRLAHGRLATSLRATSPARIAAALERVLEARQDVDHNLAGDAALFRAMLALESARPTGSKAR